MKILATYFRAKAELCRVLADTLSEQRNPVASELYSMADEFDRNASVLESRLDEEDDGKIFKDDTPNRH
jgi:hypothetical protein